MGGPRRGWLSDDGRLRWWNACGLRWRNACRLRWLAWLSCLPMRRLLLQALLWLRLRRVRLGLRWLRRYLLDMDPNLGLGL